MMAYKFLDRSGCSIFTGQEWPRPEGSQPGPWIVADAVRPCREGIHACRVGDLAFWLSDQLWEIELADNIVVDTHKIVGRRGRLVRRVEQWETTSRGLAEDAAWRTRDRAVDALNASGLVDLAHQCRSIDTIDQLIVLAGDAERLGDQSSAGRALALASDAGHYAANGPPGEAPFISAVAAGHAAAAGTDDTDPFAAAFAAERTYQSAWIAEQLALA